MPTQSDPELFMTTLSCCRAYGIRGQLGINLDATIGARIDHAYVQALGANLVVLGRDACASTAELVAALAQARAAYTAPRACCPQAIHTDSTDGLGLSFPDWRFNLRASNHEALRRLNVKTGGQPVVHHVADPRAD
jgi:phosphomannomutase